MKRWVAIAWLVGVLAGCGPRQPHTQSFLGGEPVDLDELTAAEVARGVRITPRERDIFFQAPTLQTNKLIDLRSASEQLGIKLGDVERIRVGYLSGTVQRVGGVATHFLLFQTNFVTGNDRYTGVYLGNGQPLQYTVSRAPDPCVPNCFPVVEALIVSIPDPILRANTGTGLPLTITLSTGDTITFKGLPPYVQGYLQAVDTYRAGMSGASAAPATPPS